MCERNEFIMSEIPLVADLMLIDTNRYRFNILEIENRRFMYSPHSGELILGKQYKGKGIYLSHAEEYYQAGAISGFDSFIRGWIGVSKSYACGIIHFVPIIVHKNSKLFDSGFSTLEMFSKNGANAKTVIRGFGDKWEQPLGDILQLLL